MPTYDYVCRSCDHAFELFQQMSDSVKKKCPECGALKLERLIGTGAGVLFKGSGFYETDYRSDSYKKAADAEKSAASGTSDKKADAKKKPDAAAAKPTKPETSSSTSGAGGGSGAKAAR